MRLKSIVVASAAALALALNGTAASTAKGPRDLVLKPSDFPAGTQSVTRAIQPYAISALGVRGLRGADVAASVAVGGSVQTPLGSLPKEWQVQADVYLAPDAAGARRLFGLGKAAQIGLSSFVSGTPIRLSLPAYGDEQLAFWTKPGPAKSLQAVVFVRKGAVVWQLMVSGTPAQWRPSRAQVVGQLRSYAAKQKRRVGTG
jgi:hypothetical protein